MSTSASGIESDSKSWVDLPERRHDTDDMGKTPIPLYRGRFSLSCLIPVAMEIMVFFLSKRLNGLKKPAHLGKYHCVAYEGGFWSVYWMSVAIWTVVLLFNSHLVLIPFPFTSFSVG